METRTGKRTRKGKKGEDEGKEIKGKKGEPTPTALQMSLNNNNHEQEAKVVAITYSSVVKALLLKSMSAQFCSRSSLFISGFISLSSAASGGQFAKLQCPVNFVKKLIPSTCIWFVVCTKHHITARR